VREEYDPGTGAPEAPAYLEGEARALWDRASARLRRQRVLSPADGLALELLVDAYREWRAARDQVVADGAVVLVGTVWRAHPAVAQAADAWRRLSSMLQQFGQTPATRGKVSLLDDDEPTNPFAVWSNGRVKGGRAG